MIDKRQTSDTILMVRPAAFGFHAEAAASNSFAATSADPDVAARAAREFDGLHDALAETGIDVIVLPDRPDPPRPDAVFPNNWVSFHADGTVIVYPMATIARRLERDLDGLRSAIARGGCKIERMIDLSPMEAESQFLEGTGSLVLDRPNRRAFAALSSRTERAAMEAFEAATGYTTHAFASTDRVGAAIYHTNVLMSIGTGFAVLCDGAVAAADRGLLIEALKAGGREVILVRLDQMERFACNILELAGRKGPVIAMSASALASFDSDQRAALERHGTLVAAPIPTIEAVGGGSVRCMIAEVFLPKAG